MYVIRIAINGQGFGFVVFHNSANVFFYFLSYIFVDKIVTAVNRKNDLNVVLCIGIGHVAELLISKKYTIILLD